MRTRNYEGHKMLRTIQSVKSSSASLIYQILMMYWKKDTPV